MSLHVRRADLDRDRETIITSLARFLTPLSDASRFDWLYLSNPFGIASVWLLTETDTESVVGVSSAFPRRLANREGDKRAWVLGDFCIHQRFRSLGPALQLQRATLDEVDKGSVELSYDFPSISMMSVYRRLKIERAFDIVRLAKPLRVDRKVRDLTANRLLQSILNATGNALLSLNEATRNRGSALEVSSHEGPLDEEFSLLAQQSSPLGTCVRRTAAYLNWRYRLNPLHRYQVMTARRNGRLVAFVVFQSDSENVTITDLVGDADPDATRVLVRDLIAFARGRRTITVSVPVSAGHPLTALFLSEGFRPRESRPVVVYRGQRFERHGDTSNETWALMDGDRDT